jgi:hypothetical protein
MFVVCHANLGAYLRPDHFSISWRCYSMPNYDSEVTLPLLPSAQSSQICEQYQRSVLADFIYEYLHMNRQLRARVCCRLIKPCSNGSSYGSPPRSEAASRGLSLKSLDPLG